MEIGFENKTVSSYIETAHLYRRIQESAESVVPDVNKDIGKIVSTETTVMLKAKELSSRGISVSGELSASVLYIDESESRISHVNLTKSFTMDFENADTEDELLTQVKLQVVNCEARALNPRKLSVSFDLSGELSCYRQVQTELDTMIAAEQAQGIHLKYESCEIMMANAVCEKSFAISEQLIFPSGKPVPSQLICQNAEFIVTDTQLIGSKVIIKGNANISVRCASEEICYPVCADFSVPFSQIVETGKEQMDGCSAIIQPSSAYYRLVDTINGEKAIDSEIHAVIQLVSRCKQPVRYISDVYCNLMPVESTMRLRQFKELTEPQRIRFMTEEHVSIAEDCSDVLCVFPGISKLDVSQGKLSAAVQLDIVYTNSNGSLAAAHRVLETETEYTGKLSRIDYTRISDINLKPDGKLIECRISIEASCREQKDIEFSSLSALELREEEAYDCTLFPSLSLVRVENETLWELAKAYHSSIESIAAMNTDIEQLHGKLLLIPKSV